MTTSRLRQIAVAASLALGVVLMLPGTSVAGSADTGRPGGAAHSSSVSRFSTSSIVGTSSGVGSPERVGVSGSRVTPAVQCGLLSCKGGGGGGGGGGSGGRGTPGLPDFVPGVPNDWIRRETRTGGGVVYQKERSPFNSNSVRIMPGGNDSRYPNGYVIFTNGDNHKLTADGAIGNNTNTHIPRNFNGSWTNPKGWPW